MNSRERTKDTLNGTGSDRFPTGPLAVHYCAQLAGYSIKEYTLNPKALSESVFAYYDMFKPDAIWVSADTWVTAEAMGAKVAFPDENQPLGGTGEPLVKNQKDIDSIPQVDVANQGRFPIMIEALERVVEQLGDEVFIVGCFDQSPFSLACALLGMDNAMISMISHPEFLKSLMQKCSEYCIAYGTALANAGADMLSTGDSPAGLIGKEHYRKIALPAEQKVFSALKKNTDAFLSLHICGDATTILDDMAKSGADVLEIDSLVSMEDACQIVPDDIALWGNLDPVGLLQNGTPELVRHEVNQIIDTCSQYDRTRMVLSSGCTIAMETKKENLLELTQGDV
jgi:uroporphyrinogen decarboxylase